MIPFKNPNNNLIKTKIPADFTTKRNKGSQLCLAST